MTAALSRADAQLEAIVKRSKVDVENLVGLLEIARRFGVQKETTWRWRNRKLMPTELKMISAGDDGTGGTPVWDWSVVEEWGLQTGRLVKVDGKVQPAPKAEAEADVPVPA